MPKVKVNDISMNYAQEGSGEPIIMIPFLSADHTCYEFQVAEYAKHFTCISVDLRGAGETDKPQGVYSTQLFADDVAAFMQTLGIERAHISGLSLGAATGMWLASKYPEKVQSLSLHSSWTKTDLFLKTVLEGWQVMAKALGNVTEMVIQSIFPWCFTPELYGAKPEYLETVKAFVRSRPPQPVDAFLQQSNAVIAHDVELHLEKIKAPTQITFGQFDLITSTRFAKPLTEKIRGAELIVFEGCSHGSNFEKVDEFNQKTMAFLKRHSS